jgi:hypothetical protein
MTTATGVAAGALAFEGIESLMHGFGGGHQGGGYGFDSGVGAPREEIVNNYYGDSEPREQHHAADLGSDVEDRRNDFADTGNNNENYADDSTSNFGTDDFNDDSSSNNDDSSL